MTKSSLLIVLLTALVLALAPGCATLPVYERNTEAQMIVVQEKVEDGAASGILAPDQTRMYLATLKDIRTEYTDMSRKKASREQREDLKGRLDVLEKVVDRAVTPIRKGAAPKDSFWEGIGRDLGFLAKTGKDRAPTNGETIIRFQKRIDDGRNSGAFSLAKGDEFQRRLDYIRSTYLHMMEGGRTLSTEEREVIARLLYSLDKDLNQIPRL
ncbi:MAG TPA: hypothetical protein VF799_03625 [Geobacteraceae bacterium]